MNKDRQRLNELIKQRNTIEAEIRQLTEDSETHTLYSKLLRKNIEHIISEMYPNADSYTRYSRYCQIKKKIHDVLKVNSKTLTKSEYDESMNILKNLLK